jgi:arylsulfatase
MIIAGNGVRHRREFSNDYLTVMDFAPTFIELAGAQYPADKAPMLGESIREYLSGRRNEIHDDSYTTTFSYSQRAYIRQGDWKLLTLEQPFDERDFALYNLAQDPGESVDLARSNPRKFNELLELWRTERRRLGITLPEDL